MRYIIASLILGFCVTNCASTVSATTATEDVVMNVDVPNADVQVTDTVDAQVAAEASVVDAASDTVDATSSADVALDTATDASDIVDVTSDVLSEDVRMPCVSTLTITPDAMPPSTVLVAGNTHWWYVMASYRATATCTDQAIERAYIGSFGDAASFAQVAVAADRRTIGTGVLPAGENSGADIALTSPFVVHADSSQIIQLWARLAPVVPRATLSMTRGAPLSGNVVALGIGNVHAVESLSRAEVVLDLTEVDQGNPFVVRRSKPTVLPLELPTSELTPGMVNTIYYERIAPDLAGPIRWRKDTFRIDHAPSIHLEQFRILRNGITVPLEDYEIVDQDDQDLRSRVLLTQPDPFYVTVRWLNDELVNGTAGNTYSLLCVPQGGVSGDSIRIQPVRLPVMGGKPMVSGRATVDYLVSFDAATGIRFPGPNLHAVDTDSIITAAFLWSDVSEIPHTRDSLDWANGVYIIDRAVIRTLFIP